MKLTEDSFTKNGEYYVVDYRATNTLNKVMGTNFKGVYRKEGCYNNQWSSPNINCGGETFCVVREDGKVFKISNSEWCSIVLEGRCL